MADSGETGNEEKSHDGQNIVNVEGGVNGQTWDDDSQRIFFLNGERMMAVDLNSGQGGAAAVEAL